MSTATDELVDLDVNMGIGVPCQWLQHDQAETCSALAAWVETILCPSKHTVLVCDEHKVLDETNRDLLMSNPRVTILCRKCWNSAGRPGLTWRPL